MRISEMLASQYDWRLVTQAVLLGLLSALISFRVFIRALQRHGLARLLWLGSSSLVAGLGVWATNFSALLAFHPGFEVTYDPLWAAASLPAAIVLASGLAPVVMRPGIREASAFGGLYVGVVLAFLQVILLQAWTVHAEVEWERASLMLGTIVGGVLAAASLRLALGSRRWWERMASGLLLTAAVLGQHLVSMTGLAIGAAENPDTALDGVSPFVMALGVAAVTMLLAGSAFLVSSLDRRAQHRNRLRMRELADAALDGLVLCEGGVIVDANARFEALVGMERTRVAGRSFGDFVLPAHRPLIPAPGDEMREIELLAEDGQVIPVEIVGRELKEGHGRRRVLAIRDIRERREAELRIRHLAYHDALTGLPNRVLFRQRMEDALARAERDGGQLAVLCLDLDHFKRVNDTLGHPVGDALLKGVADRLRSCGQGGYTVARLSGDEFALVQAPIAKPSEAEKLAQQMIEALRAPFELPGNTIEIGASIGIAVMPGDGRDPDELLKSADIALFRAKADGRSTWRFFESEMDARMQARRALELDLRKALAEGQLELFYQPLVDLKADQVSGFEALLRWNHPVRGMVPPMEFIPLAEEIGLILPIGDWVLRQACAEAAAWPDHVKVAVNLSPNQFRSRGLVQTVVGALASSGLPAGRLELEITETVLLQENDQNLAILHQLRGLGVRISMDDFGTGYSSLSYLRSFPFDKIKIDRSFVKDLPLSTDCVAIIRAVAGLGSSLGVTTLAEGVETIEQLERLRAEGCDEVQGFLFSRPRPARELGPFLSLGAAAALKAA